MIYLFQKNKELLTHLDKLYYEGFIVNYKKKTIKC